MANQPKKYKKFVATAATATLVANAIVPVASAATPSFSDIAGNDHEANILAVAELGLISGYADGTFGPNNDVTRGQVALILGKWAEKNGVEAPADYLENDYFTDLPAGATDENKKYYALVKDSGIFTGYADGSLKPGNKISREHMAIVLNSAVEAIFGKSLVELAGDTSDVVVKDIEKVNADYRDEVLALKKLGITASENFNPTEVVKRGHFASFLNQTVKASAEITTDVVVKSVSASSAKSLQVEFNTAVDATEAKFDVKRGTTTVNGLEVTWSEDKKVATLTSDINLAAGDYTVTVTGLADEALTGTVKVEAQKVTKVEITSKQLIKNNANPATAGTFTYKVEDQYGTDITKDTPASAFNTSAVVGTSTASISLSPSTGVGTISHTFANTDTKAVVTLVHKATGLASTSTLDVAAAVTVESVTFGENILPKGKTRIEAGLSEAVRVPLTVLDQYGSEIKDVATLTSSLNLISSNTNVTFSIEKDENNNVFLVVDTSGLSAKTTVVLTTVNPTSGKTFTKSFDVVAAAAPYAIELGELSQTTIAAGDTDIVLPIKVTDQFGEQLSAEQIVKHASTIEGWITGDNNSQITNLTVDTDKTSDNYGKLVFDASAKGTVSLVVNTGNAVQTKLFEVKDARVVSTVTKADNVTLLQGATTDLKFVFRDQYGDVIKTADVADNSDLSYKVEITKVTGDNNGLTTTENGTGTDEDEIAEVSVAAAADKTGSYKVTVTLINSDSVAVSSASTTVTVKQNNVAGLEYTLADVPTLNGSVDNTATLNATNVYAQELKLSVKDSSGQEYVINPNDIVSVASSNEDVAKAAIASGKIYVAGNNITANSNTDEKKATITVTINTLDGLKTVTKEVTVSPKEAVVEEIKVVTSPLGSATKNISSVVEKYLFEVADKNAAAAGTSFFAIGKDQYGVWNNVNPTVVVNSTNVADLGSITHDTANHQLDVANTTKITANKDILLTLTSGKATKTITYKVLAADKLVLKGASTPNATFTVDTTTNFPYTLADADIDMDPNTAGVQNSVTIDGLTYTVAVVSNIATVTTTGTVTGTPAAKSSVIKVSVNSGKTVASDTINLNITANGADFTISK